VGLRSIQPGEVYNPQFCKRAVTEFLDNGAWLLLSLDHYSWRANYDLAVAVIEGAKTLSGDHRRHLATIADLQVQSLLYAVVEQYARLVQAARVHKSGTSALFDKYMQHTSVVPLIEEVRTVTEAELRAVLHVPGSTKPVRAFLRSQGQEYDRANLQEWLHGVNDLISRMARLCRSLQPFVDRPPVEGGVSVTRGHSLRQVDNAFRHGLRTLYYDVIPVSRSFHAVGQGDEPTQSEYMIDLYQSSTEPQFATVIASPERTRSHLDELANFSVFIRQLARGLLIARGMGIPAGLIAVPGLTIEVDSDLSSQ
jgi:hypothetical protein